MRWAPIETIPAADKTIFNVRPATPDDTEKIKALLRVASVHARGMHPGANEAPAKRRGVLRRFLSAILRPLYSSNVDWRHCLVAEAPGGEIIGCGKILPHENGDWEVASLSVVRSWRGSGVALTGGKYIIDHAPRPLWGVCERRYLPLYQRFGAVEVTDPALMPAFMSRRLRTYSAMFKMARRQVKLAVVVVPK